MGTIGVVVVIRARQFVHQLSERDFVIFELVVVVEQKSSSFRAKQRSCCACQINGLDGGGQLCVTQTDMLNDDAQITCRPNATISSRTNN